MILCVCPCCTFYLMQQQTFILANDADQTLVRRNKLKKKQGKRKVKQSRISSGNEQLRVYKMTPPCVIFKVICQCYVYGLIFFRSPTVLHLCFKLAKNKPHCSQGILSLIKLSEITGIYSYTVISSSMSRRQMQHRIPEPSKIPANNIQSYISYCVAHGIAHCSVHQIIMEFAHSKLYRISKLHKAQTIVPLEFNCINCRLRQCHLRHDVIIESHFQPQIYIPPPRSSGLPKSSLHHDPYIIHRKGFSNQYLFNNLQATHSLPLRGEDSQMA